MSPIHSTAAVPRTVWMLWLQGWSQAPRIVRACRRTWKRCNPDWLVRCLDAADIPMLIDDAELIASLHDSHIPPEACSDRIRIALLERHGGVWADATTYCLQPLDEWLPAAAAEGFFAFDRPGPDRLISSWFLAANRGSPVVGQWASLTRDYWRGRAGRHHYYWFHYLFGAECATNSDFRAAYEAMPKIPSEGPHSYHPQDVLLPARLTKSDQNLIEGAKVPLLKLSHRSCNGGYPCNSVAHYLCERVGV